MADKTLGEVLHEAREAGNDGRDRPMFLAPWADRDPRLKVLDESMAEAVAAEVRGRFGRVLQDHYLAGISCAGVPTRCNPVCACSMLLGVHPGIGAAVGAWIEHVIKVISDEGVPDHG